MGLTTGISKLDKILKGYPEGPVLVEHEKGAGATSLGLTYLNAGLAAGEKVALIVVDGSEQEFKRRLKAISGDSLPLPEISSLSSDDPVKALQLLRRHVKNFDRVLFDSLDPLIMFEHDKYSPKLGVIANELKNVIIQNKSAMVLMTLNPNNLEFQEFVEESFQGVLKLEIHVGRRSMRVMKWPWKPERVTINYVIKEGGIRLL